MRAARWHEQRGRTRVHPPATQQAAPADEKADQDESDQSQPKDEVQKPASKDTATPDQPTAEPPSSAPKADEPKETAKPVEDSPSVTQSPVEEPKANSPPSSAPAKVAKPMADSYKPVTEYFSYEKQCNAVPPQLYIHLTNDSPELEVRWDGNVEQLQAGDEYWLPYKGTPVSVTVVVRAEESNSTVINMTCETTPPPSKTQYALVLWKVDESRKPYTDNLPLWPQNYVRSVIPVDTKPTAATIKAAFVAELQGKCVAYQADGYKYTTKADKATVDGLIAGGVLTDYADSSVYIAHVYYTNSDCTTPPKPAGKISLTKSCEAIQLNAPTGVKPEGAEYAYKVDGEPAGIGVSIPLTPGEHTVTLWVKGEKVDKETVVIKACPKPAEPTVTATCVACANHGQADGAIDVVVTNTADDTKATVEYTVTVGDVSKKVTLKDGASSGDALRFDGLAAGTHLVKVQGDDGTSTKTLVTVEECPTPPKPAEPTVTVVCLACSEPGKASGSAKVTVTNTADDTKATVEYTVTLGGVDKKVTVKDGESGDVEFDGLAADDYSVIVKGNDGTSAETSVTVKECPPVLIKVTAVDGVFEDPCGPKFNIKFTPAPTEGVKYYTVREDNTLTAKARVTDPSKYVLTNPDWSQTRTDELVACPVPPAGESSFSYTCDALTVNAPVGVKPEGAEYVYKLDGEPIEIGDHPITAGQHTLTLEVDGVQVDSDTFTVEECVQQQLIKLAFTKGCQFLKVTNPAANPQITVGYGDFDSMDADGWVTIDPGKTVKIETERSSLDLMAYATEAESDYDVLVYENIAIQQKCDDDSDEPKRPTKVDTDNGPIVSQVNWPAFGLGVGLLGVAVASAVAARRREV